MKVKMLNGYAGMGGNRKLLTDVEVTAIELEEDIAQAYSVQFPQDKVIVTDAHQFLLDHWDAFDFYWLSPPCQTHGRMNIATRHELKRYADMTLYQEIIFLETFCKDKLWVVENVKPYYEPLIKPSAIIGRHYFWSNFNISSVESENINNFIKNNNAAGIKELKEWLGISYDKNIYYKDNHDPAQVLRNCVHPEIGLHIFNCALNKPKKVVPTFLFGDENISL